MTTPCGLWLWNGQGKYFGLGTAAEVVRPQIAMAVALTAVSLAAVGIVLDGN